MKYFAFHLALLFISSTAFALPKDKAALDSALSAIASGMVLIEVGPFTMGCSADQGRDCISAEKPAHLVMVSSFYIAMYDVTQAQWEAVMDTNPSAHKHCPDCPVDNVSWNDAMDFISRLNALTGRQYRLPTEAEWEYAARGGAHSRGYKYAGGNDIDLLAWYDANSGDTTHPVGSKQPNEAGLYDMSGNVWQWCSDWYADRYYSASPPANPKGPDQGTKRVVRGGSWTNFARVCRPASRYGTLPDKRFTNDGFRLALDF